MAARCYHYYTMKLRHPLLALCIYLGLSYLVYVFGVQDAAAYVFLFLAGFVLYRLAIAFFR